MSGIDVFILVIKLVIILLPIPLAYWAYHMWHHYVQEDYIAHKMQYVMLEVKVYDNAFKSLLAMESIMTNAFYQKSGSNTLTEEYWEGLVPNWYSLEIISVEGRIHFLLNVPAKDVPFIKSQLYSQYPQASITEFNDYVWSVPRIGPQTGFDLWGCEWKLAKPNALPLKTYADYELNKSAKESDFFIDPMSGLLENLSTLGPKEQIWIQYIVRPAQQDFAKECLDEIEKLKKPYLIERKNEAGEVISKDIKLPEDVKDAIKRISIKMQKVPFEVGIRTIYVAPTSVFSSARSTSLKNMFRYTTNPISNELIRSNTTMPNPLADPWGKVLLLKKNRMLDWYRFRVFFHPPYQHAKSYPFPINLFFDGQIPVVITLSSDELTTLYHFPTLIGSNPGIKKIETRTSKAPTNLPI